MHVIYPHLKNPLFVQQTELSTQSLLFHHPLSLSLSLTQTHTHTHWAGATGLHLEQGISLNPLPERQSVLLLALEHRKHISHLPTSATGARSVDPTSKTLLRGKLFCCTSFPVPVYNADLLVAVTSERQGTNHKTQGGSLCRGTVGVICLREWNKPQRVPPVMWIVARSTER